MRLAGASSVASLLGVVGVVLPLADFGGDADGAQVFAVNHGAERVEHGDARAKQDGEPRQTRFPAKQRAIVTARPQVDIAANQHGKAECQPHGNAGKEQQDGAIKTACQQGEQAENEKEGVPAAAVDGWGHGSAPLGERRKDTETGGCMHAGCREGGRGRWMAINGVENRSRRGA